MSGGDSYTMEAHLRVYDDKHGSYVTVRPDRDVGSLCEIAWNEGDQPVQQERTITMPWPMARLMAQAIISNAQGERE